MSHFVSKQQTVSNSRKTSLDQGPMAGDKSPLVEVSIPSVTSPPDSDSEETTTPYEPSPSGQLSLRPSPKARLITDGFKAEKCAKSNQEMRVIMSADSKIAEKSSMSAMKSKVEANGFAASKMMAAKEDHKQIHFGDTVVKHQSSSKAASSSMTMSTDNMIAASSSSSKGSKEERQAFTQGMIHQESKSSSSSTSSAARRLFSSASSAFENILESMSPAMLTLSSEVDMEFNELSSIAKTFKSPLISKTESINMKGSMTKLENKMQNLCRQLVQRRDDIDVVLVMTEMLHKAWSVPQCGYDLGFNMSKIIRTSEALEALLCNIETNDWKVAFASAQLLEQCLISENRNYVVEHGLENVVNIAKECANKKSQEEVRVGTGILEHLFKHSEDTCKEVIRLSGLETIVYECRSSDTVTLRHCASALANLSLYGGPDCQESMIKQEAPVWLFPLAFQNDDNIQYYACLAITALVANKEIEAAVLASGTLDLVEPFVLSHNPEEFAKSSTSHIHGQSKNWLLRLVPVLRSKREEARSLAAFHFAMEAWIKKTQEQTSVFKEINAVEALQKVASCPNAIASKYAAQALRLIGEEVPHKLSQQVPLWTIEDVKEWVKQIGFSNYIAEFEKSRVDGDLLLQLNEPMLTDDIGIRNGILRRRFMRELAELKQITDYSSCDPTNMCAVLSNLGPDYARYTYSLLQSGIDRFNLSAVNEEVLLHECHIENSIHRLKLLEAMAAVKELPSPVSISGLVSKTLDEAIKSLDVFISYRRSNGSQLASLLKVHLQLRGFSVFLDVERLEAGKFDYNLLSSIRQAKYFLLVLTPSALDRCLEDNEQKDWVHREIVQALQTKCNIIPIMESFQWPDLEKLPEDMRPICYFNGIRWIHDYQDACVDKLERFMRGEINSKLIDAPGVHRHAMPHGLPPTPSTPQIRSPSQQRRSCSVDNGRAEG
ncbi:PREDICTED: sterile alpha and TIR motif-containing protein 1-like [Rhagoletis zephyria]|uniref:sterile alpha and TIR motif-containing protein 1-like n=1 Tax=Rhagoletis zephyria TaxID=28612 RepID=UPI000811A700|nr:PREDICTED: sterile alpha and TIR motif-containing protein 1-like [Rhagoletis zephyria]